MSDLLVASVQGKKPINQLLSQQRDYDLRIDRLAYDEEEFAALQKEEEKHTKKNGAFAWKRKRSSCS